MIVAGPLFNFLLAFILLVGMFCYLGVPQDGKIVANKQSKTSKFVSAVAEGAKQLKTETKSQAKNFTDIVRGKVSAKEIGGPVAIFQITKEVIAEGFWMVWVLAIILNIALGIFNLIPIPSLDGGHLFILGIEAIAGRSLPKKIHKWICISGMILLILILVLVTINDVIRLLH